MSTTINSLGLILDIIGVVVLFKFGLPSNITKEGTVFLAVQKSDEKEKKKYKKYEFWSRFGLLLLIIGFVMQIVSNYTE